MSKCSTTVILPCDLPIFQRRLRTAVMLGHGAAVIEFTNPDGAIERYQVMPAMTPERYDQYLDHFNWSHH